MMRGKLIFVALLAAASVQSTLDLSAQQATVPSFKSGVDLVRVAAVVRDKKNRFVPNLAAGDFEVIDDGDTKTISNLESDVASVTVALLLDVSGSMESNLPAARESATHVLNWLEKGRDEAAVFVFDTNLKQLTPFTVGPQTLPGILSDITPFGATSLLDAVAQTAERLGKREGKRRGVIVFTDGQDNWSKMTAPQVSAIASAIEAPVYIIGVVPNIDNPTSETFAVGAERSVFAGPLNDLSMWTGGRTFVVSSSAQRSVVAREVLDELRHQYLIAFETSGKPGWHPLVIRAKSKDLTVRARTGYIAGQSRPTS